MTATGLEDHNLQCPLFGERQHGQPLCCQQVIGSIQYSSHIRSDVDTGVESLDQGSSSGCKCSVTLRLLLMSSTRYHYLMPSQGKVSQAWLQNTAC